MRPLFHPPLNDITVQGILYALSDPVRMRIVVELAGANCPKNCSAVLPAPNKNAQPIPKSTLSQHMKILREAGLIKSERHGTEIKNTARCAELAPRFGPMLQSILDAYRNEVTAQPAKKR